MTFVRRLRARTVQQNASALDYDARVSSPELQPTDSSTAFWRVQPWLAACAARCPRLTQYAFALDLRSLGLTRIYLGCLLLFDLLRRVPGLRIWYTNKGVLPNHMVLWRPAAEYHFSLFFLASHAHEAIALFVLCGCVFLLFTLGYKTRLMHALSLVAICSLHNRLALLEDGSEVTLRLLTFLTLFLPLGARFSLDALRCARTTTLTSDPRRAVSLAVPLLLLQVTCIYLFNVLHKNGETWSQGTAVHYALQQDRLVSWLGWKLRPFITPALSVMLTRAVLATEASLPLLMLSPVATWFTRRLAISLAILLHLGFAALLNLGMFSFNMIGFFLLFVSARDWDWLARLPHERVFRRVRAWAQASVDVLGVPLTAAATPFRSALAAGSPWLREALVMLFGAALISQGMIENHALPDALRVRHQPRLLRMLIEYPRFYEGWSMFAPDAPQEDAMLVVDAITIDGRHVDPINELASRVADPKSRTIPEWLDQNDRWCDYTNNIVGADMYHSALADFIRAYPRRTHRKQDEIKSFKVWLLEDRSPAPGQTQPTETRHRLILRDSTH
ncbi:MAG: hypothetical protein RL701_4093 [Pseudomonadota bacterium]